MWDEIFRRHTENMTMKDLSFEDSYKDLKDAYPQVNKVTLMGRLKNDRQVDKRFRNRRPNDMYTAFGKIFKVEIEKYLDTLD